MSDRRGFLAAVLASVGSLVTIPLGSLGSLFRQSTKDRLQRYVVTADQSVWSQTFMCKWPEHMTKLGPVVEEIRIGGVYKGDYE